MQQKWIDLTIQKVESAKELLNTLGREKLPKINRNLLEHYVILTLDGKKILAIKCKEEMSLKLVVPLEISFQIVFNAHLLTGHGSCHAMFIWLDKSKFVVSKICTPIVYDVCKTMSKECAEDTYNGQLQPYSLNPPLSGYEPLSISTEPVVTSVNETEPPVTSTNLAVTSSDLTNLPIALVTVLDLTLNPDKSFKYLLVYKDYQTKFIQLRPLTATDLVEEISLELVKIFCDFSPPKSVYVQNEIINIFEAVLDRLNEVFEPKISLEISDVNEMVLSTSSIELSLNDWMLNQKSDAWSIGCHFVQWEINNTRTKNQTPFKSFFRLRFRDRTKEVDQNDRN